MKILRLSQNSPSMLMAHKGTPFREICEMVPDKVLEAETVEGIRCGWGDGIYVEQEDGSAKFVRGNWDSSG